MQSLPDQSLVQYKGSVANLVVDFFMFYTYKFNLYQYSVAVHDPSKLCRGKYQVFEQRHSAWPMMEVLDPVNPLNNVAQNVGIHQVLIPSYSFYRNHSLPQIVNDHHLIP